MEPQPDSNASGRELELELIRVRAEAAAARLEARAAELELLLMAQQPRYESAPVMPLNDQGLPGHNASQIHGTFVNEQEDAAQSLISAIWRLMQQGSGSAGLHATVAGRVGRGESFPAAARDASGWESRLSELRGRDAKPMVAAAPQQQSTALEIEQFANRIAMASQTIAEVPQEDQTVAALPLPLADVAFSSVDAKSIRVEPASEPAKRPRMQDLPAIDSQADSPPQTDSPSTPHRVAQKKVAAESTVAERSNVAMPLPLNDRQRPVLKPIPVSIAEASEGEEKPKRWRPAGWLISTTAHVVGLLALGLFTLSNPKPKDQLAFTASVAEVSETVVENLTIETAEEMPDVAEPTPTETAVDVSPLGTIQMAEVSLDLPTAVAAPTTPMSGEVSSESMKLAKAAVKGDTPSKVQFAGLDGGGNHFVYLVDSSNSMRKFNDARMELLRSVDSLKPDQRFYVVFYDENPKFMRISNPSQVEPASVYATPENKQAFRRWAMTIQQERGKSPPEVLQFAFKLRPDVIFLLSDGEFTARTETVIRENNLQENLFGDSGPISIIHTIRYPGVSTTEGRQAEVQMRRIATENGGQYRNVEIK